jgi:hypothetical protein
VEGLRSRGHDAVLLDHDCKCVRMAEAKCALQPKLPQRTPRHELRSYRGKSRKFIDAIARLPMSKRFSLHAPEDAGEYDAIVVGSDEVWNFRHPWYGSKPIFFGDGLKADRLVAYAASFGNHSAWDGIHPAWARKLQRFSALSVRDENSRHLVRSGTDREPPIVLDPCLQFSEVVRAIGPMSDSGFAAVYGHGFPDWLKRLVRRWADRRGLRLVSIGYSNDWADEQRVEASPVEFAEAMGSAHAIISNFFHGCVFALLNGKPWATVPSDYRSIKIPDLAAMLGTQRRLVSENNAEAEFDYLLDAPSDACGRLQAYRAKSDRYLDAALS